MNKEKYVFTQIVEFLNNDKFRKLVDKYDGNRYVMHFTCWNQLLAMIFGQFSNRESLRDLIVALEAHQGKRYHLGLGRQPITKTTLATANQNCDYRIFESLTDKTHLHDLFNKTNFNDVKEQLNPLILELLIYFLTCPDFNGTLMSSYIKLEVPMKIN